MKKVVLKLVEFYQKNISFLFRGCCRFHPSCSEYFKLSVERFGVLKGGFYGVKRLLKCNPFFKPGLDPVKKKKQRFSLKKTY